MSQHHSPMGTPLDPADPFNVALHDWLDDEHAVTVPDVPHDPVAAYHAVERAVAEADSHTTCGKDARDFNILIQVVGVDGEPVIHSLGPEHTLACVLGALARDASVAEAGVMGIDGLTYNPPAGTPDRWLPIVSDNDDDGEPEAPAA